MEDKLILGKEGRVDHTWKRQIRISLLLRISAVWCNTSWPSLFMSRFRWSGLDTILNNTYCTFGSLLELDEDGVMFEQRDNPKARV